MKRLFLSHYMLGAAMGLTLCLLIAACSDDDNNNGGAENEQSTMPADANDDATVLGSLLATWVDGFTSEDVNPAILGQSFEATAGEVVDTSQPTVRTVVVGTQEGADDYALQALRLLGIGNQPVGFTWSNTAIGTISYAHGTGNELGVISVNVKQLPHLTKLRLVKDYEGNAPQKAYYKKGDIVFNQKDSRCYVCVNEHVSGDDAIWVSFDSGDDINSLSVGTCGWMGAGDDIVYNKEQARADYLRMWIQEFLLSDDGYQSIITHMKEQPASFVNQLVPSTQKLRTKLINSLIYDDEDVVLELNKTLDNEDELRVDKTEMDYRTIKSSGNTETRRYYPLGLLLSGSMRWSMGFTYDYWQPYIVLTPSNGNINNILDATPSMNEDPSHFKWALLKTRLMYQGSTYNMMSVAMHWTHTAYQAGGKKLKMLVDFTKHRRTLDGQAVTNNEDDLDWTLRNITSHYLRIKDNGQKYKNFQEVYRSKESSPNVPKDDVQVKVGYLIGADGKFYVNKAAVDNAGTDALAMVVYKGRAYEVENNQAYNCLAIALEDVDGEYSWNGYVTDDDPCAQNVLDESSDNYMEDVFGTIPRYGHLDGLAMTERLANHECNASHTHAGANEVWRMQNPLEGKGFSSWFIPSVGQVSLAMQGQGYTSLNQIDLTLNGANAKWKWEDAGCSDSKLVHSYMTTTEVRRSSGNIEMFNFSATALYRMPKMLTVHIRPFIAFTAE